jgi:hypothetical protein
VAETSEKPVTGNEHHCDKDTAGPDGQSNRGARWFNVPDPWSRFDSRPEDEQMRELALPLIN